MGASPSPQPSGRFHITIVGTLWLMALLASSLAAFGTALGLLAAGACVTLALLAKAGRQLTAVEVLVAAVVIAIVVNLLVPAVAVSRVSSDKLSAMNNLRQLTVALINYNSAHSALPNTGTGDEEVERHSWRTKMLTYLDQQVLHNNINHSQSWDSLSNRKLLEDYPMELMRSPRFWDQHDPLSCDTHYFAVVGEETLWPPGGRYSFDSVPDGAQNTILLVEAFVRDVPWYKPQDLSVKEAIDLLCGEGEHATWIDPGFLFSTRYEGNRLGGVLAAFADGSVRVVPTLDDRELALALLTPNGRETIDVQAALDDAGRSSKSHRVLGHIPHWDKIIPTAIFVVMAFLPWYPPARRRLFVVGAGAEAAAA